MGASDFIEYAENPILTEAFAQATEEARYSFGHAGYTGTIAEKSSVVRVSSPLSEDDAVALANKMLSEDDERISDKWGPAGAIPVERDGQTVGWVLFGWASA